jgi:hypothetical protein
MRTDRYGRAQAWREEALAGSIAGIRVDVDVAPEEVPLHDYRLYV